MKKAPSMLLASAGVTVGLLGFALPASAAASPNNSPATTQSTSTAPKLSTVGGSNSGGTDNNSGGMDNVTNAKFDQRQSGGNGYSRDKQDPCKSRTPEPCPTKPCRTEKPRPCHSWTWHKAPRTVPCHQAVPCQPPKKRPCPPPVYQHHKKCDTHNQRVS